MFCLGVLPCSRNVPERGLLSISGPIAVLSYRVPTWLVLPMVIALAHDEPLFCPDDLGANVEARLGKAFGDDC